MDHCLQLAGFGNVATALDIYDGATRIDGVGIERNPASLKPWAGVLGESKPTKHPLFPFVARKFVPLLLPAESNAASIARQAEQQRADERGQPSHGRGDKPTDADHHTAAHSLRPRRSDHLVQPGA